MQRNYRIPKADFTRTLLRSTEGWNVRLAEAAKRPVHIDVRLHLMIRGGLDWLDDPVRWFGTHILARTIRSEQVCGRYMTGAPEARLDE